MRLDQYLVTHQFFESRNKAQTAIKNGWVQVDGKIVLTVSEETPEESQITLLQQMPYVSRGGEKLAHALKEFNIDVTGKICLDLGSSTGGFTDCLLQHGGQKIYAVDVGTDQLHPSLRENAKVAVFEKTHVREIPNLNLDPLPSFAVMDLSFISALKGLQPTVSVLDTNQYAQMIVLLKPQFEQDLVRESNEFEDVITDDKVRQNILDTASWRIEMFYPKWQVKAVTQSPIVGGDGNIEYLLWLVRS
jgi:23S rRNA (cytidine1920-2'-O)/16S rRNA (cytidine1409-2'-O)-methyltransferase